MALSVKRSTAISSLASGDTIRVHDASANLEGKATLSVLGAGLDSLRYGTSNLSNTPSAAELAALFGTAASAGAGAVRVAEDSSDGKNYVVISDGTTWHFVATTASS